ncbi:TPA: hypothetical protein EYO12_03740 [Candidatus Saccharibacteria bacterium]|nr:hypothetical protein [Candidatus Saccharibacteria bacterium]HIO87849.1 hypothetical protein [Candidatus Saccharibacteria bacterium]
MVNSNNLKITHVSSNDSPKIKKEITENKELIYFFTWRQFKIRYKQTHLGVVWAVIQPLIYMIILSVIIIRGFSVDFGHPGTSPALSVFASLIIWSYFEKNISSATTSLVSNASLLRKIYIPRFIPVLSMVLVGLIDFLFPFSFFLILNLLLDNNFNPLGLLIMFPLLFLMATLLFGAGLFMGTLNLKYRDAQLVMPFIIRVLFFTTPIFYPISFLPEKLQLLAQLNPLTPLITAFRDGFYSPASIDIRFLALSGVTSILVVVFSILFYKKKINSYVDAL